MKNLIFSLIISLIFSSCLPSYIKKKTWCFSSKTIVNPKIRLNGWYVKYMDTNEFPQYKDIIKKGDIRYSLIFYNDGSVVWAADYNNEVREPKDLYDFYSKWGTYKIVDNNIIFQSISKNINSQYLYERTTKILNDSTIQIFSSKKYLSDGSSHIKKENDVYHFVPLKTKPDNHYFWLKKKEWFWCDKNEHKSYMQELKNRGKGF